MTATPGFCYADCVQRKEFRRDQLRFSYLDAGGQAPIVVALHAHFMEAAGYMQLGAILAPEWRLVALDQRGHGYSDHSSTYTREDYLSDLQAFVTHLGAKRFVLLGNSLGGVNAYQYAARHPRQVQALVVEDIGIEVHDNLDFVLAWQGEFATIQEFEQRVGPRMAPYLHESLRPSSAGWKLPFEPREIAASAESLQGNFRQDWVATDCPALVVRGRDSRVTTQAALEAMVAARPNTRLEVLEAGHVVHADNPFGFANAVRRFLNEVAS